MCQELVPFIMECQKPKCSSVGGVCVHHMTHLVVVIAHFHFRWKSTLSVCDAYLQFREKTMSLIHKFKHSQVISLSLPHLPIHSDTLLFWCVHMCYCCYGHLPLRYCMWNKLNHSQPNTKLNTYWKFVNSERRIRESM